MSANGPRNLSTSFLSEYFMLSGFGMPSRVPFLPGVVDVLVVKDIEVGAKMQRAIVKNE